MKKYKPLDSGLYELNLCEVLGRIKGEQEFFLFGDCDSFTLDLAVTRKERKAKRGTVRTTAVSRIESIDSTVTIKYMQFRRELRAASLLGRLKYHEQAAMAEGSYTVAAVKVGAIYGVGYFDISGVAGPASWVEDTHYEVVDAANGHIEILALPDGVTEGSEVVFTFAAAAIDLSAKRTQIDIAKTQALTMELKLVGTAEAGFDATMHLYEVPLAPSGAVEFLDEEFASADLTGMATLTALGVGTWTEHRDDF